MDERRRPPDSTEEDPGNAPLAAPSALKDPADSGTLEGLKDVGAAAPRSLVVCPKGHVTSTPLDEGCHFRTGEYQDEVFDTVEIGGKQVPLGERVYLGCGEPVRRFEGWNADAQRTPSSSDLVSAALPSGARQRPHTVDSFGDMDFGPVDWSRAAGAASPSVSAEERARLLVEKHGWTHPGERDARIIDAVALIRDAEVAAYARGRKELEGALRDLLAACTSDPGAAATADAVNHARRALLGTASASSPPASSEGTENTEEEKK